MIGKRMLLSLKGILKSAGEAMLDSIKQARCYSDPDKGCSDHESWSIQ